jgi:hypothetical protein
VQVDFLVLYRAPQPLDHDIVAPVAAPAHAHGNSPAPRHAGERLAGELATQIRIEDLRLAIARQGFLAAIAHLFADKLAEMIADDDGGVARHDGPWTVGDERTLFE